MRRQTKYFLIELLCLIVPIIDLMLVATYFSIFGLSFEPTYIIPILILLALSGLLFYSLCKSGFGKQKISPHIYTTDKTYTDIINDFSGYFNSINILDENTSYVLAKKKGMWLRFLLMHFDDFAKEDFKKRKDESNKIINKKHNIKQYTNITNINGVRINFIVVDEFNEYCLELANTNANILFARVECILNVFLSEKDGKLFIPAHYGINCFDRYYKTLKIIEKVLNLS